MQHDLPVLQLTTVEWRDKGCPAVDPLLTDLLTETIFSIEFSLISGRELAVKVLFRPSRFFFREENTRLNRALGFLETLAIASYRLAKQGKNNHLKKLQTTSNIQQHTRQLLNCSRASRLNCNIGMPKF